MSDHELMPAIALMERKVVEAEQKVNQLLGALNVLRGEAGLPPRPGGGTGGDGGSKMPTQIKPDTFFGKKQQTAVKQFLDMRKAQGLTTATPREIYDALVAGGYEFEAKTPEIALVGLRALLRKRTETFVQIKNGTYGLLTWYPDMKKRKDGVAPKVEEEDDADDTETETASNPSSGKDAA